MVYSDLPFVKKQMLVILISVKISKRDTSDMHFVHWRHIKLIIHKLISYEQKQLQGSQGGILKRERTNLL